MASVRYFVSDVDRAVAFYTNHLGFTLEQQFGPAIAITSGHGLTLLLSGPPSSAARPMPDGRVPGPGGWNRIMIEVDDLDESVSRLRAANVKFRNDILTGPGGRQILLEDPDGNLVELFEPAG